jgi:hypothetical protein
MGRKSAWAAARAEVIASGVRVAGWESFLGQVASLESYKRILKRNTCCCRNVSKIWAIHVLSVNVNVCCKCRVCHPKLVVKKVGSVELVRCLCHH